MELFLQTKLAKKKFGMVETKAFKGGKEKGNFQEVPLQMQSHYTKGQLILKYLFGVIIRIKKTTIL